MTQTIEFMHNNGCCIEEIFSILKIEYQTTQYSDVFYVEDEREDYIKEIANHFNVTIMREE